MPPQFSIRTCSKCGKPHETAPYQEYVFLNNKTGGVVVTKYFKDKRGRSSVGNVCHACVVARSRKKRGYPSSRDESKSKMVMVAVAAEKIAAARFESLGFIVERTEYHGPDLKCRIGNMEWTVEVKRARRMSSGRSYETDIVCKNRKSDDLIAIVMPNGAVVIDSMKNHLSKCQRGGCRSVTKMVRENAC